ncbi:MAG: SH3 domain-containing protein [Aggregatilineales bacterium]
MRQMILFIILLWVLAACGNSPTQNSAISATPTDDLGINEIVETNAAASSPIRTSVSVTRTPLDVSPRPTPTLACDESPRTRLIVGERGLVSDDDPEPLNVRSGPGTGFTILGIVRTGDVFDVIDGPRCGGDYAWFLITDGNLRGWIAEGDFGLYYVEPYLPG